VKEPRVTVLMPVYNGEAFLHEAITSVLSQTFGDFELLVINDGSTDRSVAIADSTHDPRIRIIDNEKNRGLIYSLNKGLDLARGEYIARMDCDDTSLPRRLEKQVGFMRAHPEIGISGTWIEVRGKKTYPKKYPADSESIRCNMLFYCAVAHPSVIIRKEVIKRYQLYFDESYVLAEDYELWVRALNKVKFSNLPEILVRYRLRPDLSRTKLGRDQLLTASRVRRNQLAEMGFDDRDEDLRVHEAVATCQMVPDKLHFGKAEKWLLNLREKNKPKGKYPERELKEAIGEAWFRLCEQASKRGLWTLKTYLISPLSKWGDIEALRKLKFAAKCLVGYSAEA
jgi:glycosyltransferase involved in cell wall biosynthesis